VNPARLKRAVGQETRFTLYRGCSSPEEETEKEPQKVTQNEPKDFSAGCPKSPRVGPNLVLVGFGSLGTTPAVAAGVEFERWSLERVVEMTADYLRGKEDALFEAAFANLS
jgi:hypothetical protein